MDIDEKENLIKQIKEAANITQKIFFSFIVIVVYCIITVFSISDKDLIFQKLAVKLPIFNINVTLAFFYIGAPILIIFLYLYLNFNHIHLMGLINKLKEKYPASLKKLHSQSLMIFPDKPDNLFRNVEKWIMLFLRWWTLPVTIFIFTFRYIKTHDRFGFYALCLFAILAFIINYYLYNKYFSFKIKSTNFIIKIFIILFILINLSCISLLELGLKGVKLYFNTLDLSYQDLRESTNQNLRYSGSLKKKHLEGANLIGSYCENMNLRQCYLQNADLSNANFKNADFLNANINNTQFSNTILCNAVFGNDSNRIKNKILNGTINFERATLTNAKFINFKIKSSENPKLIFKNANLIHSYFNNVDIKGADFSLSNLAFSYFNNSKLKYTNFDKSYSEGTTFKNSELENASFIEAHLECADFREIKLINVDFSNAYIQGANFLKADVEYANFINAQIDNTKFFAAENMNKARFNDDMDWEKSYKEELENYRIEKIISLLKKRTNLQELLLPEYIKNNFFNMDFENQKQIISSSLYDLDYSFKNVENNLNISD